MRDRLLSVDALRAALLGTEDDGPLGKRFAGNMLNGREWAELPDWMRV